jgi:tetratricopeptide (TPR) repeat protein
VGWFWYLATLVPVIGFIQVGGQAMADRFTYLPSIGPFIMVAWESRGWATKWQFAWPLTGFLCALLLFAYALVAFRQVGYWKDSITMFQHTLRVTGNNALAHFNLGCAYSAQQRTDEAIREYLEALRIDPRYAKAQYNLEAELAMRTAAERARSSQPTAARTQSELADAHSKLGFILLSEGKLPQAIQHFSEAANLEPMKATRHRDLGRTLALAGNSAAAVRHLEEALRLDPQFAEARRDLDELLKQTSIDKPAPQASPP